MLCLNKGIQFLFTITNMGRFCTFLDNSLAKECEYLNNRIDLVCSSLPKKTAVFVTQQLNAIFPVTCDINLYYLISAL